MRIFPRLAGAALEMKAQGFRASSLPCIFSTDLREIPPALNEDLLDLYGRSEQILANRFCFFHAPKEFSTGIDWATDEGSAWSRELHSFDFALDLAMTYRISREKRYARRLRYVIADWVAANPQTKHGVHRHAPEDFGLDADDINRQFVRYRERFGFGFGIRPPLSV